MSALIARGRLLQPHQRLALRRCLLAAPTCAPERSNSTSSGSGSSSTTGGVAPTMATSSSAPAGGGAGSAGGADRAPGVGAHGTPSEARLLARLRDLVPPLSPLGHKGSHGKVGVVGGCAEYTGAPYFAAMAALRAGCDLAYVFCTRAAAPVIKSYSPELIVLPCLPCTPGEAAGNGGGGSAPASAAESHAAENAGAKAALAQAEPWIARLGCLIVGPGLGDDPRTAAAARELMQAAFRLGVPVVVDGSAINIVARDPGLFSGQDACVLTPNLAEFGRLAAAVELPLRAGERITAEWQEQANDLCEALRGPVLVSKGPADVVALGPRPRREPPPPSPLDGIGNDGDSELTRLVCTSPASLKRSGGQGDVLTGIMAALICWSFDGRRRWIDAPPPEQAAASAADARAFALAAWGACWLMRAASASAFASKGRGMLAGDILDPHVADAVVRLERSGGGGGGGSA